MNTILYGDGVSGMSPCVATIGFFDGIHRGHQHLIGEVTERAKAMGLTSTVVTFDRHPRQVVKTDFMPQLLSTTEEKLVLLEKAGIDNCIVLPFDKEMASMSAHDFMRYILSEKLGVKVLITGYDHRFGHNRSEGFDDYVRYGEQMGMEVILGKPYIYEGVNVSSSVVRALISEGEVDLAANCQGYRYTLLGHVESGHHIGTELGFPTANIHPDSAYKMIPANGVYAVMVRIAGEQADRKAMLNIGQRPTFEGKDRTIEANIFDFNGNIYGKQISIAFFKKIRDERKLKSAAELKHQLQNDEKEIRKHILL